MSKGLVILSLISLVHAGGQDDKSLQAIAEEINLIQHKFEVLEQKIQVETVRCEAMQREQARMIEDLRREMAALQSTVAPMTQNSPRRKERTNSQLKLHDPETMRMGSPTASLDGRS